MASARSKTRLIFCAVIALVAVSCNSQPADPVEETSQTESSASTAQTTTSTITETRPTQDSQLEQESEPNVGPVAEADPNVLAEFVSQHNGDFTLDGSDNLTVQIREGVEGKEDIPPDFFVVPTTLELFKILGLVEPDADGDAIAQHRIDTIRGACCPVSVWDNDDDPLLTSVVTIHELTHLADDRRRYFQGLTVEEYEASDREQVNLVIVPVEGNASRVDMLYQAELEDQGADPEIFRTDWFDPTVPKAMTRVWEFAYLDGQAFMQALADRGGDEFVDLAFERAPISSKQVYDVDAYLAEEVPVKVDKPELPVAATEVGDQMVLGAFVLQLLAEETMAQEEARSLATAWAGDTTLVYELEDQSCVSSLIIMDSANEAADLVGVLAQFSDDATIDPDNLETVRFTRCILRLT